MAFQEMSRAEKAVVVLSYVLRASIAAAIVGAAWKAQWLTLFLASFILILTFLPFFLQRRHHVHLPTEFELAIVVFIYAALFLGEVHAYYTQLWWWDLVLHAGSGLLFGFAGFLIIYTLNYQVRLQLKMAPGYVALFGFTFAVAAGAIWEIFEFVADASFGLNMQKSGLLDTMGDLIVDALGALLVSVLGYVYLKKGEMLLFTRLVRRFVEKNPGLFGVK